VLIVVFIAAKAVEVEENIASEFVARGVAPLEVKTNDVEDNADELNVVVRDVANDVLVPVGEEVNVEI